MAQRKKNKRIRDEEKKINSVKGIDSSIWDKVYVVVVVLLFIFAFYILTLYITNKHTNTKEKNTKNSVVSNEKIIVGNSLSMKDKEYYVLFYNDQDEEMSSIYDEYKSKNELPIYKVDMSDGFNKKYTGNESNTTPNSTSDIKITGSTLIKVVKGKVVNYIEGVEEIRNYLN